MKMSRKIAAAVTVAAIALSALAGCAGSGATSGDKTTISFWTHTHPPMIAVYKKLIAEYEKKNPNITIKYQTVPNNEFGTKILTSLSNGSGPDLINMDDSALRGDYIPKNLLAPVDPKSLGASSVKNLKARYVSGSLAGATGDDGTLYGLPSEFNGTALAINAAHFAEAGLDPAKPLETWDDVAAAGKKLEAAGHRQAYSFLYLHSGWYSQQFQTLLHQTGGAIAKGDTGTLDSAKSREALQVWADLAGGSKSTADPNATSREATVPFQDLATGVQSMAVLYPWSMDQIKETNPDTYKNLKILPLPQVDPSSPSSRVYAYYWAVNKASKVQPAAWKFVNFLSEHNEEFLTGASFVQPVIGWQKTDAAQSIPFIDAWSKAYATGKFDEVTPHYSEVQDIITKMVNDVVFDKVSVEKASKEASDAVSRVLQN